MKIGAEGGEAYYCNERYLKVIFTVQVNTMRRQLGIRVSGFDVPGPIESFEQCGLDPLLMASIRAAK